MTPGRTSSWLVVLSALTACGDSDAHAIDAGGGAIDAGLPAVDARVDIDARVDAARACELAPDCLDVVTPLFTSRACCGEGFRCGFGYEGSSAADRDSYYRALGVEPSGSCIPESKLFRTGPTIESQRVPLADGGQVLIAAACPAAYYTSFPFRGCCLPNNECAVSTYPGYRELGVLAGGANLPFTQIECVKSEELNAQLRSSSLAGLARFPSTSGSCDHAALDLMLPPAP
ncbi:MAG TPA: hypothetical protein VFX59_08000 [Polyangiales bacterium]|nr:hypothetical protein [Polyangiales bacterium]